MMKSEFSPNPPILEKSIMEIFYFFTFIVLLSKDRFQSRFAANDFFSVSRKPVPRTQSTTKFSKEKNTMFDVNDDLEDVLRGLDDMMSDLEDLRDDLADGDEPGDASRQALEKIDKLIDLLADTADEAANIIDEDE